MTSPHDRRTFRLVVQSGFRYALYLGFLGCLLTCIAVLSWGGAWWAPMFGTIAFGIPAVAAYLTEQEHQQDLETRRQNRLAQQGGGGSWDLDDDGGDPAVPPAPRERNR